MAKVAINGLGRIGRAALKIIRYPQRSAARAPLHRCTIARQRDHVVIRAIGLATVACASRDHAAGVVGSSTLDPYQWLCSPITFWSRQGVCSSHRIAGVPSRAPATCAKNHQVSKGATDSANITGDTDQAAFLRGISGVRSRSAHAGCAHVTGGLPDWYCQQRGRITHSQRRANERHHGHHNACYS